MEFLDRTEELTRLDELAFKGGLAVIWGRRRIGKTKLLLEWSRRHDGLYTVADQSAAPIQRRYLATAVARKFREFDRVEYPDWRSLLQRITAEARQAEWRGPLIFDEFPYLVATSPELPSVFQAWVDHEVKQTRLAVAIAGSSQRMMQGLVTHASEPLYGRAGELLHLRSLPVGHLPDALKLSSAREAVLAYTAWGGVPRYWELAEESGRTLDKAVDHLVLNPLGPLHEEPERLLLEELPPAVSLRPILDAIGLGAHKVSEIAARIGQPSTSLVRPLQRLQELGLVRREVPFGVPSQTGKRSLYRIADPFCRLWFRVVASNRGILAEAPAQVRLELWQAAKSGLVAVAWEELCHQWVPLSGEGGSTLPAGGGWMPPGRYWRGEGPEWDVVSLSLDKQRLLLGEAKWMEKPADLRELRRAAKHLVSRGIPPERDLMGKEVVHILFMSETEEEVSVGVDGVHVVTASEILRTLR